MDGKFTGKSRKIIRHQHWDYRWDAPYFITICTKNRAHFFGEISHNKMNLSGIGILADVFWHEIKNHAENVILDAFQVMPNHIHGIIILNTGVVGVVGAGYALPLPPNDQTIGQQRFQHIGINSISSIIGSYKSAVTKHAHRLGLEFEWQSRFHDHIIRDEFSFQRIANYIDNNVANWKEDRFYDAL